MKGDESIRALTVLGWKVIVNDMIGHAAIHHDGGMNWDILQCIKNELWGKEARAIEVYPATSQLVNERNCRHLWLLGRDDFCPDLLGESVRRETLEARFGLAWHAAWIQIETRAKDKLGVS